MRNKNYETFKKKKTNDRQSQIKNDEFHSRTWICQKNQASSRQNNGNYAVWRTVSKKDRKDMKRVSATCETKSGLNIRDTKINSKSIKDLKP